MNIKVAIFEGEPTLKGHHGFEALDPKQSKTAQSAIDEIKEFTGFDTKTVLVEAFKLGLFTWAMHIRRKRGER